MVRSKYGVVVCPRCGMAKGVETRRKTTTCQCGREIKVFKRNVKYLTDSPLELAETVAEVNAALRGGTKPAVKKQKTRPRSPSLDKALAAKTQAEKLRTMAEELSKQTGDFSADDLKPIADSMRKSPEAVVKVMLESGMIYESKPGRYRLA